MPFQKLFSGCSLREGVFTLIDTSNGTPPHLSRNEAPQERGATQPPSAGCPAGRRGRGCRGKPR